MIDDVDGLPAVAFADLFCAHHVNVTKTYGVQYNFGCEYHPFRGGHNFRTKSVDVVVIALQQKDQKTNSGKSVLEFGVL